MLKNFKEMAELVKANPVKKRIVLCCAHDEHSLDAVYGAFREGIVEPVFVGKEDEIKAICAEHGFDFGDVNKMVADPNKMMPALFILAKYGAILNGQKVDFDQDWIDLHTPVSTRKIIAIQLAIINTISENMDMESEEDEDLEREVDLVLQEIQKKSERINSPGGKSQPGD